MNLIESIKTQILNKNESLLNYLDYSLKVQKTWCSTFYLVKIFMESYIKNLEDLVLEDPLSM